MAKKGQLATCHMLPACRIVLWVSPNKQEPRSILPLLAPARSPTTVSSRLPFLAPNRSPATVLLTSRPMRST